MSTACQVYTPVQPSPAVAGKDVRVTLTQGGSAELASTLGAPADVLEGRLVEASDSLLVVSMKSLTRTNGVEDSWNGESVRIPARDVSRVETSQTSRVRSTILAVALVGGAILAGSGFVHGQSQGSAGKGSTNGQQ
jgi:hypothetical protein